jgi:hypothetical protein
MDEMDLQMMRDEDDAIDSPYEELCQVKSYIEFGCAVIETLILNESDERMARYMSRALEEMQRALSYLSYAEFEMSTRPQY